MGDEQSALTRCKQERCECLKCCVEHNGMTSLCQSYIECNERESCRVRNGGREQDRRERNKMIDTQ